MEKNKLKFIYTTIQKAHVEAESKDAIKVYVGDYGVETAYVWIQKKYAFPSQYMHTINISLVQGWEYELKNEKGTTLTKINADQLKRQIDNEI